MASSHFLLVLTIVFTLRCLAQSPPAPQHEANFEAERTQANDLFLATKYIESLPLYEDLCHQDQTVSVFAERHGIGLLYKAATLPDATAQTAMKSQGLAELRRAQSLGDNSPLVQNILESASKSPIGAIVSGVPLTVGYSHAGTPAAQDALKQAESAFVQRDYASALKLYDHAAQLDPAWYQPPLFAGDAYFRLSDWNNAGLWFAKAIAIDPNRDTAYRYWGDALYKAGDASAARLKYEQAVIAEPYGRSAWNSFQQWANVTKTRLTKPQIERPEFTTPDGKLQADPVLLTETGDGRSSWLVYERARVTHGARTLNQPIVGGGTDKDGQLHPIGYRHTLAEESECLTAMLDDLQQKVKSGTVTQDRLDPSLAALLRLQQKGDLDCWIVLFASDGGIRYDYPAFRKQHRDQLIAYLESAVLPHAAAN